MNISIKGLLKLKPFDETADAKHAKAADANNELLALGIVLSFILATIALSLALAGSRLAWPFLTVAVGLSAVTAGLEWNPGFRARSLNQLFATVLATAGIILLSSAAMR